MRTEGDAYGLGIILVVQDGRRAFLRVNVRDLLITKIERERQTVIVVYSD